MRHRDKVTMASGFGDESGCWWDCAVPDWVIQPFHVYMSTGHFPSTFKEGPITSAIKKPGLDVTNAQSYHPISNLSVVSKLLERIVAQQLNTYLRYSGLVLSLQSGIRSGHSTETAVLSLTVSQGRLAQRSTVRNPKWNPSDPLFQWHDNQNKIRFY